MLHSVIAEAYEDSKNEGQTCYNIMSFSYVLTGTAVLHSPQVDKQLICSRSSTPAVSVFFFFCCISFSPPLTMTALTQTFTATSNAAIYNQGVQEPVFAKVLIWRRQTVPTHKPLENLQHTAGKGWCVHSQNTTSLSYIPYSTWQWGCFPCCPPLHEPQFLLTSCFVLEKWRWFSHLGISLEHWSHCLDQDIQALWQSLILHYWSCIHLKRNSTCTEYLQNSRFRWINLGVRRTVFWGSSWGAKATSCMVSACRARGAKQTPAGKQVLADGPTGRD